jgi:diguanylate cyclase (GGDEF)-like protein/PAS domain S-box-containing protein
MKAPLPETESRRLAEVQTREELLRFRVAMDMSGDAIYLVDRETMRFVDVNQTACKRMGYSREELLRLGPQDLLKSSRADIEKLYDEVIAAGAGGVTTESTARTKDGRESMTELHRCALRSENGWTIVSIARDITLRKRAEQALLENEERFRLTFELAGSGIANVDLDGRFQRVNRSLCELLGYSEAELVGRTVKDLSHPEDRDLTDAGRARVRSGELESTGTQKRYLRKDGTTVWVHLTVALVRDAAGSPQYEIAVFDDETERVNAQAALRHREAELQLLTDNVPAMIMYVDRELKCVFVNRRYADFFGFTPAELVGKPLRQIVGGAAYPQLEPHFVQALGGRPAVYQRNVRLSNGEDRCIEVKVVPRAAVEGEIPGCYSMAIDVTEQKQAEERIRHIANHDSLTGLPNRMLFNDRLGQTIRFAKRVNGQFGLLYLDLDKFKPVNDVYGHDAGDQLLKSVGERIRAQLRESDTVARLGGDEFAVIIPDVKTPEDVALVARKIIAALTAPFVVGAQDNAVEVGTSIGIAIYPADAKDHESLIRKADLAMYAAKQAGGSGFSFSAA